MTALLQCSPRLDFELPANRIAVGPPEARGLARDDVMMLVADGINLTHRHAYDLAEVLEPGDVLVVNTSQTLPAALRGTTRSGEEVAVHLSTVRPGDLPAHALRRRSSHWVVELREPTATGSRPTLLDRAGEAVRLPAGGQLLIDAPFLGGSGFDEDTAMRGGSGFDEDTAMRDGSAASRDQPARLWLAELSTPSKLGRWLAAHGGPIRYGYAAERWPIDAYRTAIGTTPGSAEMPSAGRILTPQILGELARRGVHVAKLVLHCGVSSPESHEPPYPEWYAIPRSTAALVNRARAQGRRVVAVGTTVVRALESAADETGRVRAGAGWTDLVITPARGVRVVGGLLTGWHEPGSSHLQMLAAIAEPHMLCESYRAGLEGGYLWHEFGDVHLLLPTTGPARGLARDSRTVVPFSHGFGLGRAALA